MASSVRSICADLASFVAHDAFISVRVAVILLAVLIALVQKLLFDVSLWSYLSSFLENPYFGATFSIVGIGAGLAALQQMWSLGQHFYATYMTCSIEMSSGDESFQWVLQWIFAKRLTHPLHLSVETVCQGARSAERASRFQFVPSTGVHHFLFKGKWIQVQRSKSQNEMAFGLRPLEKLILRTSGRDTGIFQEILQEALDFVETRKKGKITVYCASAGCWATLSTPLHKRPLSSVILDQGIAEKLLADLEHFVDHCEWYVARGIPYRRGYLLHGPPGTGKTSFIMALAGFFNLNICMLNLSEKWLTDDVFNQLLCNAPQDSVFLLEDVDAAFLTREGQGKSADAAKAVAFDGLSRLTFSGFLNAIDGAASAEGRILFMTTNYVQRLDPALLRPGRIDVCQYIGYASEHQLRRMYRHFYPDQPPEEAVTFAALALDTAPEISMAQVQGLFLLHKYDPENLLQDLNASLSRNTPAVS
ncbi:mitochondrial chaperone BCS1-like [Paramacrobiotus metropolitanus]|uniref:mitochondrial chaperone BCS1-like n=1 Tax=Paramacrobiotus metropolitanus TaxID=2943436 RepID=UPI0024463565|nr:mitochondrial chaperone BCS1-like [Paramacrobiotus metropolitanus]